MFFKGVELTSQKTIKYCSEHYCNKSIPLCSVCISPECCESSSKWFHISFGEHICLVCYNRIQSFFSYDKNCNEINEWKKNWLKQSHENAISTDFLMDKLMPMWCICWICKKWRQVNRDLRLNPIEIKNFQCSQLIPHSKAPCQAPEDSRIEFIRKEPQKFFESLKYQPLLESAPYLELYDEYPLDVVGISPTAEIVDFAIQKCPDFLVTFNPFLKRSKFEVAAGSVDESCMDIWEHEIFPMFSNNLRNIFIGLRNLMMVLWASDPKRVVDESLMNQCTLIHGIVRVALLIHTIPDILRVYTGLGYINYGFIESPLLLLENSVKRDIIVVSTNLAGLVAANHLARLGANVTVLEHNETTPHNSLRALKMLDTSKEVQGCVNNPLSVAAYQLGIELRQVCCDFTIFNYDGTVVTSEVDGYFQSFVYNFVDYIIEEWNKMRNSETYKYDSVQELFDNYHTKEFDTKYADNVSVQEVYLAEIEYRMFGGAPLDKVGKGFPLNPVSMRGNNFDMNYYAGDIVEPTNNWSGLREKLVECVDVSLSAKVQSIVRSGDKYVVTLSTGKTYESDKVVLSMDPWDMAAIEMGTGVMESTAMVLDGQDLTSDDGRVGGRLFLVKMLFRQGKGFWRGQLGHALGAFAIVPKRSDERGFCHIFKETEDAEGNIVLESRIFGAASRVCHGLTDGEIVARVLRRLACVSPHVSVSTPRPYGYEVQRYDCALVAAMECGAQYKPCVVADESAKDVYVASVQGTSMQPPRSLTQHYVTGLRTATTVARDMLII